VEELGLWVGFALTLMVYSYLIRDNLLYRLAVYVFVGLAAGYIAIVTVESVLIPWFDLTIGEFVNEDGEAGNLLLGAIPFILFLLLLFKSWPSLTHMGNIGIAVIIGVGVAVALVGALTGTLFPLAEATAREGEGDLLEALLIFIGVATSLLYFQYLSRRTLEGEIRRSRAVSFIAAVGKGFIVVTLGALYAAAILTSLTIFSERMSFVFERLP
jgi:hypothetical protein